VTSNASEVTVAVDPKGLATMGEVHRLEALIGGITCKGDAWLPHISEGDIHVTGVWKRSVEQTIAELIAFTQRRELFVTAEEREAWNEAVRTAREALLLGKQGAWDMADVHGRLAQLEGSLRSAITANPFVVGFDTLDGVTLEAGVWKNMLHRIEC
jgi:hypothetical protein